MNNYPAPPIPDDRDLAGNYYWDAIQVVHTGIELEDLMAWLHGQTLCLDNDGRTVVMARDYEEWVDEKRRQGYGLEAERWARLMRTLRTAPHEPYITSLPNGETINILVTFNEDGEAD